MMPSSNEKLFVSSTTSAVESGVAPCSENGPSPSGHHSPKSAFEKRPGTYTAAVHSQMSEMRRMFSKRLWFESKVLSMNVSDKNLSK